MSRTKTLEPRMAEAIKGGSKINGYKPNATSSKILPPQGGTGEMSGYCNECHNQHCICDLAFSEFNFGDKVKIKLLELYGYITAICYRGDYQTYEVSFFSNGEYQQKWVEHFEVEK